MTSFKTYLFTAFALLFLPLQMHGQQADSTAADLLKKAGELQASYRFSEAENIYNKLLSKDLDSALRLDVQHRLLQCGNGSNLMQYIVRPTAVATADYPVENFYLHLQDTENQSWMPVPNPFVNIPAHAFHPLCSATYFNEDMETEGNIIYSAPDKSGKWKIYTSSRIDSSFWSAPQLLSPNIASQGNDIFPKLSNDGQTLYFASDALAGMGGYDLFYSTKDPVTGGWSTPENLGFPYSSTANDIFYTNSNDGLYSIIVSDRETTGGTVRIYVTEYVATPVRTSLEAYENPVVIAKMTAPKGASGQKEEPLSDIVVSAQDAQMQEYAQAFHALNTLKDTYNSKLDQLETSRRNYEKASSEDKKLIAKKIMETELEAMQLQERISQGSDQVRKVEMELLSKGIIPVLEDPTVKTTKQNERKDYIFPDHKLRSIPYIILEVPKPKFDYTFKVGGRNEGKFVEDNSLPAGIVYQIQFAVLTKHATVSQIKGLSPVFVYKQPSGKYVHTVGLFRTYAEGSSKVKEVRKAGFSEAFLVAYKDGKSISVKKARTMEGASGSDSAWQLVISGYPDALPSGVITAIRGASDKDISKTSDDSGTLFMVGPFSYKKEAEDLMNLLKGLGVEGIRVENIKIQ